MSYRSIEAREAYRQGARDSLDAVILDCKANAVRAAEGWLVELDNWHGGDPPPPPHKWPGQVTLRSI